MTCHEFDREIDEYVEGTLPPARVAAAEAHLATCSPCRAQATDFRALRAAVTNLETYSPPPHVWTRVAAQTRPSPGSRAGWLAGVFRVPAAAPWGVGWRSAAAAAVLLAAVTVGTWTSWREVSESSRVAQQASAPVQVDGGVPVEDVTQAISRVQEIVQNQSAVLPGETKAAYQAGIEDLDDASREARAILAEQPANEMAQQSLLDLLQSKLALLQEMVALINEMRQGNQEEAARIVSGLEK
jgi:hypothetical protein